MHSMVWPAKSPDLNIIENVWFRLKRELKNGNEIFLSKNQLESVIRRIWINIPISYIFKAYIQVDPQTHTESTQVKGLHN